jgi:hypothetical protein
MVVLCAALLSPWLFSRDIIGEIPKLWGRICVQKGYSLTIKAVNATTIYLFLLQDVIFFC